MINIKFLQYSDILNAIQKEISPSDHKIILDKIINKALEGKRLTNNHLIADALLLISAEQASDLFIRLEDLSNQMQSAIDITAIDRAVAYLERDKKI